MDRGTMADVDRCGVLQSILVLVTEALAKSGVPPLS